MVSAPGSKPTITPTVKQELKQRKVLAEDRDATITQSTYALGVGGTLSGANLQPGDALPDDSDSLILSSHMAKAPNTAEELAVVVARKPRARVS
jgi:hypothetical protein